MELCSVDFILVPLENARKGKFIFVFQKDCWLCSTKGFLKPPWIHSLQSNHNDLLPCYYAAHFTAKTPLLDSHLSRLMWLTQFFLFGLFPLSSALPSDHFHLLPCPCSSSYPSSLESVTPFQGSLIFLGQVISFIRAPQRTAFLSSKDILWPDCICNFCLILLKVRSIKAETTAWQEACHMLGDWSMLMNKEIPDKFKLE